MTACCSHPELFVWAHRGASGIAPENTLTAFRLAEDAGADGIELDVHLSRDGVPVVIHDETLDRTTSGHGPVAGMRASELLRLDAGGWFSEEYAGESIPLLSDVLDWAGDRLRINIEIKSADAGQAVLETLLRFPLARVLVSSFNHKLLFRIRQAEPNLPIGFLVDSRFWRLALRRAVACRAEALNPPERFVTRALIRSCHEHGLAIFPWTVDAPSRKATFRRLGVDGFFTNLP